jgi:ribosomal protein L14E/L6E/L27E
MEIRIGEVGKVVAGEDAGKYVKVVDDSGKGLLILLCSDPEMRIGFDDWVQDIATLRRYFSVKGWTIEWLGNV